MVVHPADIQDRDGAPLVLDSRTRRLFPFLETIFADGAYGGQKLHRAMADAAWRIEVVKRSAQAKGFEVIPRRWVVERTIAWINRCRRLAKDYENLNRTVRPDRARRRVVPGLPKRSARGMRQIRKIGRENLTKPDIERSFLSP